MSCEWNEIFSLLENSKDLARLNRRSFKGPLSMEAIYYLGKTDAIEDLQTELADIANRPPCESKCE